MKGMGAQWSVDQLSPPSPHHLPISFSYIYINARKASARAMKSCQENKILADSGTK